MAVKRCTEVVGEDVGDGIAMIGLIGLGPMGSAVGERLRSQGVDIVVHNRTGHVAEEFSRTHGATVADSPGEVAEAADVVLTCVADMHALHEVCTSNDGLLAGLRPDNLVIDLGTTGPAIGERLAPRVADIGAMLLESPVAGTPGRARRGALVLMTAGSITAHERALPVLEQLGHPMHVGDFGSATALKLALNLVLFGLNESTLEALAIVRDHDIETDVFMRALGAGPAGAPIHEVLGPQYRDADLQLGVGTYATVAKDLELLHGIVDSLDDRLPVARALRGRTSALVDAGEGSTEMGAAHIRPATTGPASVQPKGGTDMTPQQAGRPVAAGEGRVVQVGPLKLIWKEEGDGTDGRLAVAELVLSPGFSPPAHFHREHDEGFYVLEGEVLLTCGDEEFLAGPGDWLMVPTDMPHTFSNPGTEPARLLCTFSPNQYVEYFDRLQAAGREHGGPPPVSVFKELMADYATEMTDTPDWES